MTTLVRVTMEVIRDKTLVKEIRALDGEHRQHAATAAFDAKGVEMSSLMYYIPETELGPLVESVEELCDRFVGMLDE